METGKKLVRGLKDVSPLFGAAAPAEVVLRQTPELQVLAVSSPGYAGDSLFLNAFFASQIASSEKECTLVSILSRCSKGVPVDMPEGGESLGDHLRRYCLYRDEFADLLSASPVMCEGGGMKSRDIFLDFEYGHQAQLDPIIRLLDKWVLLLKPTAEGLTEGYKIMKAGLLLNPQLEFFIALEGKAQNSKGEMIFERFSEFVFKHLSADLGWLGWVDLSKPEKSFSPSLQPAQLQFQSWNEKASLEKFALAGWIASMEQRSKKSLGGVPE